MSELLDLHTLKIFEAVARHKNFSRAAEELYMSQPAVSQHIKALEDALETKLFIRTPREIILTEAGEVLLEQAELLLKNAREIKHLIRKTQNIDPLHLKIGFSHTAAYQLAFDVLSIMQKQYPETKSELFFDGSLHLSRLVLDSTLDFAFISGKAPSPLLQQENLCTEHIVAAFSSHHEQRLSKSWSTAKVKEETLLVPPKGNGNLHRAKHFPQIRCYSDRREVRCFAFLYSADPTANHINNLRHTKNNACPEKRPLIFKNAMPD